MKSYTIQIQNGGEFACREDEYILAAMHRSGCREIVTGCYGGGCGICKMRIVTGEVEYAKPMSRRHVTQTEHKQGLALMCCVRPRSNIVIARVE